MTDEILFISFQVSSRKKLSSACHVVINELMTKLPMKRQGMPDRFVLQKKNLEI